MPHKPGEICEHCRKHIHPRTLEPKDIALLHPPPACDACLPRNHILKACASCKLVRYCGRDCQKVHWPIHKKACKINAAMQNDAKGLGEAVEAKQASFARWCENNVQQFAEAAFHALGIHSPLDREKLPNYAFLIMVNTEDVTPASSKKPKFAHSILSARQASMREMHIKYDWRFRNPANLDEMLSHTPGLMRILVNNLTLPLPYLDLYTLPADIRDGSIPPRHNPLWLAHLRESIRQ